MSGTSSRGQRGHEDEDTKGQNETQVGLKEAGTQVR